MSSGIHLRLLKNRETMPSGSVKIIHVFCFPIFSVVLEDSY